MTIFLQKGVIILTEKKKLSLKELMQQKAAEKKTGGSGLNASAKVNKNMGSKSQLAKKPSTTRRKMGA